MTPDSSDTNGGPERASGPNPPDMGDVFDELEALEAVVDDPEELRRVRETKRLVLTAQRGPFGRVVSGFDRADAAEALLGSLLFGIPMFVEGGTGEVGAYVATHPLYFLVTLGFALSTVVGILYVADIQDVRVRNPLFGLIPRKLLGVVVVAAFTAIVMMTAWGRVDWAVDPWVSVCDVTVAFFPMAIGSALGDILPGS
ncbi:DUF2391 domain-containing protein [Salinirubellus sp. GCM10025818]|uniref:DUF2391 domain-containing protein n=1 Tax=Salinirubellus TaxID=2162630 RepID=UPI003621AEF8